jgi:hypothetical protein
LGIFRVGDLRVLETKKPKNQKTKTKTKKKKKKKKKKTGGLCSQARAAPSTACALHCLPAFVGLPGEAPEPQYWIVKMECCI